MDDLDKLDAFSYFKETNKHRTYLLAVSKDRFTIPHFDDGSDSIQLVIEREKEFILWEPDNSTLLRWQKGLKEDSYPSLPQSAFKNAIYVSFRKEHLFNMPPGYSKSRNCSIIYH